MKHILDLRKTTVLLSIIVGLGIVFMTNKNSDLDKVITPTYSESTISYRMPEESEPHEGTWLEWPHHHQYGYDYRDGLDGTWVVMTKYLVESEKVHIVAYDDLEKDRIINLLTLSEIPLDNIDFKIYKNDDVWMRDNGPIFVRDNTGKLVIQDWGFNGWGSKEEFKDSDLVPAQIAKDYGYELIDLNNIMINEGGAVEIDGNGTLMATRSSILNGNRNPGMSQSQAEAIFNKYLGVTNFVWLSGVSGLEVTDMHIDGFARFGNKNTIVTMSRESLVDWQVPEADIDTLYNAKNIDGKLYNFLEIPLTENNVTTEYGKNLGYKGSYINYYIANSVVLVPNYNDSNDKVAIDMIQKIYPTRKVVGIDVRNLYENGGMIHCVTQQQPQK